MRFKINIMILFFCQLFISCNNEESIITSAGKIEVAFSVTLPEPEEVLTRAYNDKDIKNLTVLVFDHNNKFMERIDVDESDIVPDANGVKFNVVVDATPDNRTLHLIANARTGDGITDRIDLSGLSTSKTEAQIIPTLTTKVIAGNTESALIDNIAPLIMWGRVTLNGVNVTTKVDNAKLLRSVACVRIKKDVATFQNGLDNLTITKMAIHNGMDRGYVASTDYNTDVTATPLAGNPYTVSTCDYTRAWSTGAEPVGYIYERNCDSNNYMSVILGATYNGKAGYYKIVLANGDNPVNIIRNHRYTITVLSVNGPGYETAATAASMPPSNALKAEIVDDHDRYPFIIADSKHWMGLSNNILHLIGANSGTHTANVELCTVYSSRGIAPVITNKPSWITINVASMGGNEFKVIGSVDNGSSATGGSIYLNCDNLSLSLGLQRTNPISSFDNEFSQDADSYAFNFVGSLPRWRAWIPNPSVNNKVHLHPTEKLPSALTNNAGAGMTTELTAIYHGKAYLHVAKEANRKDEIWTTSYSGSTIVVRKTIIAQ